MTDELLYYNDLSYADRGIRYLNHFNFSVYAGETVKLICRRESEKQLLLQLLSGSLEYAGGSVYHHGRLLSSPDSRLRKITYLIRESSRVVGSLTAGENIFVLRPPKAGNVLLNAKLIHSQAQQIFDSFNISMSALTKAKYLSNFEKYLLELIRAYIYRAEVILIDGAAKSFSFLQQRKLDSIYKVLVSGGMSLVFFTVSPDDSLGECDRYALYNCGQICQIYGRNEFDAEKYRKSFPSEKSASIRSYITKERHLALSIMLGEKYCSFFYGDRAGILDETGGAFERIYCALTRKSRVFSYRPEVDGKTFRPRGLRHCHESGIVFANIEDVQNELIESLSVIDNIFLSSFKRLSTGPAIRGHLLQHAVERYSLKLGVSSQFLNSKCELSDYQMQLKIYLERLRLCRPKILVCREPYDKSDDYCRDIWNDFFADISAEGTAVIVVSGSIRQLVNNFDRIIRVD